jgi:AcrR family transcriptional regulator
MSSLDQPETEVPRPSPRARRREATLAEVLGHAEALVAAEGLEALTMHRLAAVHGVRVAALYRYWASKDALLAALLGRVFDQLFSSIAAARASLAASGAPGEAALARLLAAAHAYLRFADARPEASALLTRMLASPRPVVADETSRPTLLPRVLRLAEDVGQDLRDARTGGALSEGDDVTRAVLLWTSLQGLVSARKMSRFGVGGSLDALERELCRALFSGWGADTALLARATDAAMAATTALTGVSPAAQRRNG